MTRERLTGPSEWIDERFVELEVGAEAVDDFGIGLAVDFQAHGVAFAAIVELGADGFQQRTRLFFLEVEVAVAGDAKGGAGEDFVAAIHAGGVTLDEVGEKDIVLGAVGGGHAHKARQGTRNGENTEHGTGGAAAFAAQQQREAHGLVQDAGKGWAGSMVMGVSSGSTSRW